MIAYFNGSWIENKIVIALNDRALQFGDGVFETMIYQQGKVNYLTHHIDRLNDALTTLNMDAWKFTEAKVLETVYELLSQNAISTSDTARIKVMIWRKGQRQKAYASSDRGINYLIQAFRADPIDLNIFTEVGYAHSVHNFVLPTSTFKTLSSLPYVLAAQERDERSLEELIILDLEGNLSECIASNLVWIVEGEVFTPALSTGCINGIIRRQLPQWCEELGLKFEEVLEKPKVLKKAEHVFSINVAGINVFNRIEENDYLTEGNVLSLIIEKILNPN